VGRGKKTNVTRTFIAALITFSLQASAAWKPPTHPPPLPHSSMDHTAYDLLLQKMIRECGDDACKSWAGFVRGNLWLEKDALKSCEAFSSLASDTDFPLYPIVLAKQAEICRPPSLDPKTLFDSVKKFIADEKPPRWLESILSDALVPLGDEVGIDAFVTSALDAARLSRSKKNKIRFLQRVLERSKELPPSQLKEIQAELWRISPKLNPIPDDWLSVGLDAMATQDPELAAQALERVARSRKSSPSQKRTALENLRPVYRMLQKKEDALRAAKRLWDWNLRAYSKKRSSQDDIKNLHSSGLALARAYWTENDKVNARLTLDRLEKITRRKIPSGDIHFIRGRIFEEEGQVARARKWFISAVRESAELSQKNTYQWQLAWLDFKSKNWDRAIEALLALRGTETEPGRRNQQQFWLAKAYLASRKIEQAQAEWEKLINEDPYGYYSLLAYRELKRPIPRQPEGPDPEGPKYLKRVSAKKVSWDLFDWLISVGEFGFARQMLQEEAPLPDPAYEDWLPVAERHAKAHSFAGIFSQMGRLSAFEKRSLFRDHASLLFPAPYRDLVEEFSRQVGIWPEYVLALIRQESSFDALSVSPAFAFGLMQILPSIAKKLASKQGVRFKSPSDLLDPGLNVRLGTAHLRDYWDRFDGQFLLTTAGYNASPEAVIGWVKSRYRGDPLIFIEDIPYEETRSYVKLVLRNFINYQRLHSSSSVAFPEWCLEGFQPSKN
jgi:soluble lytic murein transglycosylase